MEAHQKRLRFRFSLRAFFVVMTTVTMVAWYGPAVHTVYVRKALRREVMNAGGQFDFFNSHPEIAKPSLSGEPVRYLLGDKAVYSIEYPESWSKLSFETWLGLRKAFPETINLPVSDQHSSATSLAFSPDGKLLAAGKNVQGPMVVDVETGKVQWAINTAACCAVSDQGITVEFRTDGKELLVGAQFIALHSFDVATGKRVFPKTDPMNDPPGFADFAQSPEGKLVAVQSDNDPCAIAILDTSTWSRLHRFSIPDDDAPWNLGFAADGAQILLSHFNVVSFHDVRTGKRLKRFQLGEHDEILAFSPDGTLAVTACNELWDLVLGRKLANLPSVTNDPERQYNLSLAQFDRQQSRLLTFCDVDGALVIELPSRKILQSFKFPFDDRIEVVTLSSDGRRIATAGWGSANVCIWDVDGGRKIREFPLEADFSEH